MVQNIKVLDWFFRDNLRQKFQDFSRFHKRLETWGIAFTSSTLVCYLFILFNYYYISFHKDSLQMNKDKVWFIADKDTIKKKKRKKERKNNQIIECLLKGNIFFVANGRYRFSYTVSGICVVLLNLVELQKNEIYLFLFMSKN